MNWPAAFFSAALLAAVLMERAIGKNLDNTLKQLFFMQQNPRPSPDADTWFWIAFTCSLFAIVLSWRAFSCIRRARHAQQSASPNGGPAESLGNNSDVSGGPPSVS
jgi:hypothetical protein